MLPFRAPVRLLVFPHRPLQRSLPITTSRLSIRTQSCFGFSLAPPLHNLCIFNRKLHNQSLVPLPVPPFGFHHVPIQPPQPHQRIPMTDILNKAIPSTPPSPTPLFHLSSLSPLKHNLSLPHNSHPLLLPSLLGLPHRLAATTQLLLGQGLANTILDVRGESDNSFSGQRLKRLAINVSRDIPHTQSRQTHAKVGIVLNQLLALPRAALADVNLCFSKLAVKLR